MLFKNKKRPLQGVVINNCKTFYHIIFKDWMPLSLISK